MDTDEVLTQAEVESLLSAMETQDSGSAAADLAAAAGGRRNSSREKITPYDFKRPERVGKEQVRALRTLHEGFGRNFGAGLSALLRSIVEVRLTSVDQLTYSEFVFSLENPTCFNLLRAEPLEGNFILDINPSILYPVIDRLLGGGKDNSPLARRPLTEIELRLVSRITGLFLRELKLAWANVVDMDLSVERVESNPQLVQIVPPNEVVVLISFELTIQEIRGMMNLCIPFNSIERISSKLASNSWATRGKVNATAETVKTLSNRLDGSLVEILVELASTNISTADLVGLRVGDIITTDKDVSQGMSVNVGGTPRFLASPGAIKGHKAFQVQSVIAPEEKS